MFVSVVSNHSAAVGIYMVIHHHLYSILQVKAHCSSDHGIEMTTLQFLSVMFPVIPFRSYRQMLGWYLTIGHDHFHISLFFIHISYCLTMYNVCV